MSTISTTRTDVVLGAGGDTSPLTITSTGTVTNTGTNASVGSAYGVILNDGVILNTVQGNTGGGIRQAGAALTVTNAGLISGTYAGVLDPVAGSALTVTNTSTGIISGTSRGITSSGVLQVVNQGTVAGGVAGGVIGSGGGTVTNSGLISGDRGVYFSGVAGNVVNDGDITGTRFFGIRLQSGGSIMNEAGGVISGFGSNAGIANSGALGNSTVSNAGTITGATGITFDGTITTADTVTLAAGGTIIGNGGTAISFGLGNDAMLLGPGTMAITGTVDGGAGVDSFTVGAGTTTLTGTNANFINFETGSIAAGGTFLAQGSVGFGAGLAVTATGTLAVAGTLYNAGTLTRASNQSVQVTGGTLVNEATGLIEFGGVNGTGNDPTVQLTGASTLQNLGTITNSLRPNDIQLNGIGGVVLNGSADNTTALLSGTTNAIVSLGSAARIANYGTILGTNSNGVGVLLTSGTVTNGAVGSTAAHIQGGAYGVYAAGVTTLTNFGTIAGGVTAGVYFGSGGALINAGVITGGSGIGVRFGASGTIMNDGTITGDTGLMTDTAGTAITNAGLIQGAGIGLQLVGSGLENLATGRIIGNSVAVEVSSGGTVTNAGTLSSAGTAGVSLAQGGTLENATTGVILNTGGPAVALTTGTSFVTNAGQIMGTVGIAATGDAETVINAGTITGTSGTAVTLDDASDLLRLMPGQVINGVADGAGLAALELAPGAGALSGLGTQYADFATLHVAAGATWTLGGSNPFAGAVVNDGALVIQAGGSLRIGGALTASVGGAGRITVTGSSALTLSGAAAASQLVDLAGTGGVLRLDAPLTMDATVTGFSSGDTIDVRGVGLGLTLTLGAGNLLTLTGAPGGDVGVQLDPATSVLGIPFAIAPGGAGGTLLTVDGPGNRVIFGDVTADAYTGAAGDDTLYGALGDDTLSGLDGSDRLDGGTGADLLVGGLGDDSLSGGAGSDVLLGGTGNDSLIGGTGDDAYGVDIATDVVVENPGEGFDVVYASVSYTLPANVDALILTGDAAANLTGNASGNALVGNAAANTLTGLGGDDVYGVNGNIDTVVEAANGGYDEVYSSADYTMTANVETLFLTGGAVFGTGNDGNNAIIGNDLDNVLQAGAGSFEFLNGAGGNDILIGGTGHDEIVGGAGADYFRFTGLEDAYDGTANVGDFIYDFAVGVDKLQLNAVTFGISSLVPGINFLSFPEPVAAPAATPTLLYNSTSGILFYDSNGAVSGGVSVLAILNGVPNISASDFSFY